MRTEKEIRNILDKCSKVADFGMSKGPCPCNSDGERGCCAECSFPSALTWVLGEDNKGSDNGQNLLAQAVGLEDDGAAAKARKKNRRSRKCTEQS